MPPQVTLIYRDDGGSEARAAVAGSLFRIGRAPDNDLVIADTNLSRRHATIEIVGDAAFVSDCGSQNGTTVNGEAVGGSVELRDGDTLALAGARHFTVRIERASQAPFAATAAPFAPLDQSAPLYAQGVPPRAPLAAPAATNDARPAWLNPIIIAPAAAVLLLLVLGVSLLAFKHLRAAPADADDTDPLESATTRGDATKRGDVAPRKSDDDASTRAAADTKPLTNGDVTSSAGTAASGANDAVAPARATASDPDDLTRDIKLVMSRISNDSSPYISAQGVKDVTAKVRQYKGSPQLRDRLRAAQRECGEVGALAQKSGLNPTLLMYAAMAESESGGAGDPASVARAMSPKLSLLSATFGTATANSSLILIAAYPYPFDPAVGTQERKPHPLATKLVQFGGRGATTDPSIARTVWYLKEKDALTPEAYDLVVRLLAVGVVAQNPARFGVDSPPLLC